MDKQKLQQAKANLIEAFSEQPLVAVGLGAALLSGAAKLMNANTNRRNSKTWKKEVNRRTKSSSNS